MERFIHLSDLHIRRHADADENRAVGFLVQQLLKRYDDGPKPTVVITGDITDDGAEAQYKLAAELLTPLHANGFRLLLAPGNHDYGPGGNLYTDKALEAFEQILLSDLLGHNVAPREEFYPYVVEVDSVVYVGVDSVVANADAVLHFAAGEVGLPQRTELLKILTHYAADPSKTVVTYFHHHPFDRKRVMRLDDAEAVLNILSGRTDFVLFGHDHASASWRECFGIDWMLASGKSTEQNRRGQYYYSEVSVSAKAHHSVATVSVAR